MPRKKDEGERPEEVIDVASRLGAAPKFSTGQPEDPPARLDAPIPSEPSGRTAPRSGEIDLLVTPLPTPDDWHHFELALRKVRGVSQLQPEYYRHGVLKLRISYTGPGRLAQAIREIPGYRVRIIGEDRSTLQILIATEGEEHRPG
jgi:hypothetical protein